MRACIITGSSCSDKNEVLYECLRKYATGYETVNFGCFPDDSENWSYVETALISYLLIESGCVDIILTGCSSGQGMALAMNCLPGIVCGFAPSPFDAYLFGRINGGNALSVPLKDGFGWKGNENLYDTVKSYFDGPFGCGYPEGEALRKKADNAVFSVLKTASGKDAASFLSKISIETKRKIQKRKNITEYILQNGNSDVIKKWLSQKN